jgi:hypothetical protein
MIRSRADSPAPVAHPVAPALNSDAPDLDAYFEVAQAIGFEPPIILKERFRRTLASTGLPVYSRYDVARYLDRQYGQGRPDRPTWGWRPMRPADVQSPVAEVKNNDALLRGFASYEKAIPLPVLITVQRLLADFPGARFFVSDDVKPSEIPQPPAPPVAAPEAAKTRTTFESGRIEYEQFIAWRGDIDDPFLMVEVADELFIVEKWDEPGFRG